MKKIIFSNKNVYSICKKKKKKIQLKLLFISSFHCYPGEIRVF